MIWKCVTSAPSAALRVMTRPLVVCVSSSVVALVTFGVSATVLTVMVAVTTLPPRPASTSLAESAHRSCRPEEVGVGGEFQAALPSAKVIKLPLIIGVVPSFWNSVPLVMLVILKCVTSVLSAALRLMTRPVVDCTSSLVVALVTLGVSAIALTVIVAPAGVAAESCVSIAQRGLHVEAKRRRRAEQVRTRREFQTGVALGEGDEVAARDRRGAVVQEQRAAQDVRDLEVRDFRAVGGIAANDEARGGLRVLVGRGVGDRRRVGDAVDMIDAVTTLPPRPALALLVEACTSKLPVPEKLAEGVNFKPAFP